MTVIKKKKQKHFGVLDKTQCSQICIYFKLYVIPARI